MREAKSGINVIKSDVEGSPNVQLCLKQVLVRGRPDIQKHRVLREHSAPLAFKALRFIFFTSLKKKKNKKYCSSKITAYNSFESKV